MCGRYYVDDETAKEINKLIRETDERLNAAGNRDVYPTNEAPILTAKNADGDFALSWQKWGFPGIKGKGVIINARSETAAEKRMFQNSIKNYRCIIPATHFYEWNAKKEKFTFFRKDSRVLFLAGCFKPFDGGERFVILTSPANASSSDVHERLPLILERDQLEDWIFDDAMTNKLLAQVPVLLGRKTDYEQTTLSIL